MDDLIRRESADLVRLEEDRTKMDKRRPRSMRRGGCEGPSETGQGGRDDCSEPDQDPLRPDPQDLQEDHPASPKELGEGIKGRPSGQHAIKEEGMRPRSARPQRRQKAQAGLRVPPKRPWSQRMVSPRLLSSGPSSNGYLSSPCGASPGSVSDP